MFDVAISVGRVMHGLSSVNLGNRQMPRRAGQYEACLVLFPKRDREGDNTATERIGVGGSRDCHAYTRVARQQRRKVSLILRSMSFTDGRHVFKHLGSCISNSANLMRFCCCKVVNLCRVV